ncbi:hypothetical protein KUCAC02_000058 [Chaenocephalus aceratus]|nr:hypothetical protein KUCAC02_000058 [Chaenocephalus aceratus]
MRRVDGNYVSQRRDVLAVSAAGISEMLFCSAGWCRVPPSDRLQDHGAQTQSNSAATPHERNMAAVRPYGTLVWFRSISKPAHIQSRRQAIPH